VAVEIDARRVAQARKLEELTDAGGRKPEVSKSGLAALHGVGEEVGVRSHCSARW
jgi:hypothetical protein